jgi:hypothetical protein
VPAEQEEEAEGQAEGAAEEAEGAEEAEVAKVSTRELLQWLAPFVDVANRNHLMELAALHPQVCLPHRRHLLHCVSVSCSAGACMKTR